MPITVADASADARYRTFWRRAGAAVLDFLVLMPLGLLLIFVGPHLTLSIVRFVLYLLNAGAALAYSILLHARYGQTLGKRVTRVKVVDISGTPIGMRQALWRDGPWLVFALVDVAWATTVIVRGFNPFRLEGDLMMPVTVATANMTWLLVEFATMLTNRRRRAVHDWIARTVVVKT